MNNKKPQRAKTTQQLKPIELVVKPSSYQLSAKELREERDMPGMSMKQESKRRMQQRVRGGAKMDLADKVKWLQVVGWIALLCGALSCTQEQQNKISRSLQNWTGAQGVLDVFSEGKILYRIIHIDKISTATSTSGVEISRPYRFGYGVMDVNMNYIQDADEKVTYFEFSDYSTPYIFYQNPLGLASEKSDANDGSVGTSS